LKNYQDRFTKIVEYIEANLDKPIDIEHLCRLAHLSKFHFHRQCSANFGMPIMSLVKLLKLKRAAYQLAYRHEKKVLDIALDNGYESHEAFTRAFKKHFFLTPSAFRKEADWSPWQSKYEPILKLRTKLMRDKSDFNVEISYFSETLIATLEHRGSPASLGTTIARFIEWRKKNNLPPSKSRTFNLIYDDPNITPPDQYRFDIGCSVDTEILDKDYGIVSKSIPAGKYAKIRHVGSDDSIGIAVNYLYSTWLQNSSYELRDIPMLFERVSFFPEVPEYEMITDIYLAVK